MTGIEPELIGVGTTVGLGVLATSTSSADSDKKNDILIWGIATAVGVLTYLILENSVVEEDIIIRNVDSYH